MKRIPLSALVTLTLMAAAASASAADWHAGSAGRRYAGSPLVAAQAYLKDFAAPLRLEATLQHQQSLPFFGGYQTVRFSQSYQGLPVFNSAVAVRLAPNGEVRASVVDIARGLNLSTTPSFDEGQIRSLVGMFIGRPLGAESQLQLGVLGRASGGGFLVWRVDVPFNDGMHRFYVDAQSGQIRQAMRLAMDVKGRVYDINVVQTPTVADEELLNLFPPTTGADGGTSVQRLAGTAGTVYRFVSGDIEQQQPLVADNTVVAPNDAQGDFLYDPLASQPSSNAASWTDNFAEVNIYFHLNRMRSFFRDSIGLGTKMDGSDWSLFAVGHYGPGQAAYDNAFFTPYPYTDSNTNTTFKNAIFIGEGQMFDYAYDSDVFLHEYTHYVNNNAIGFSQGPFEVDDYGFTDMPGAMDEGSADYFSCSVNNNSTVGEATLAKMNAQRELDSNPGTCPNFLVSESHQDGELLSTAAWAIRKLLIADLGAGPGQVEADQLIWGAMTLLTHGCTFGDWAKAVMQGANDLKTAGKLTDAELQAISAALQARGLDTCGRFQTLDTSTSGKTYMMGLSMLGQYFGGYSCTQLKGAGMQLTSQFHYQYTPKPTDARINFQVTLASGGGGGGGGSTLDWDIYVRRANAVTFTASQMYVPVPDQFDYKVEHLSTNTGAITIDASSSPVFDPSLMYDMVIVHRNCGSRRATVTVSSDVLPAPDGGVDGATDAEAGTDGAVVEPEGGADGGLADGAVADGGATAKPSDSGDSSGCGCRVGATNSSGAGWGAAGLLALAGVLASRRRRS